jgi:hypothetical protein
MGNTTLHRRALVAVVCAAGSPLLLQLVGCGDKIDAVQPAVDLGGVCAPPITYERQTRAILDQYCTRCHSSTSVDRNGAPATVNLDTYAAAAKAAAAASTAVQTGGMPPSGARPTEQEQALLKCWVDQGSKEK